MEGLEEQYQRELLMREQEPLDGAKPSAKRERSRSPGTDNVPKRPRSRSPGTDNVPKQQRSPSPDIVTDPVAGAELAPGVRPPTPPTAWAPPAWDPEATLPVTPEP